MFAYTFTWILDAYLTPACIHRGATLTAFQYGKTWVALAFKSVWERMGYKLKIYVVLYTSLSRIYMPEKARNLLQGQGKVMP